MYVYHLRAENLGLHPNPTCVHGDRGCGNTIPGDAAETRGFALSMPKARKSPTGLPRATHCTDRTQTSGNVTPTVELCPTPLTFRIKVRARRNVSEEKKNDNNTCIYEVRRCVFDRCIEREMVVVVRSPAAGHQPHAYAVTTGAKSNTWSTAAVVSLLL